MNIYKINSKFLIFSIVATVALVGFSIFLSSQAIGSLPDQSSGINGSIVTENVPLFGCDIGPILGGTCSGAFRQNGQGTGWSVNKDGKRIFITNSNSSNPGIQTLSINVVKVDVDDDGSGDGWSKDTCRGGGGPFPGHRSGDNCAGTIYPNTQIWRSSAGNDQFRVVIDGTAVNKLEPGSSTGIWGGFNAQYVVKTLVCNPGFIVGAALNSCVSRTTQGIPPSVVTLPATNVTNNSATLNGSINPNGLSSVYYFEYGVDVRNLGNSTAVQHVGSGTYSSNVLANVYALTPGTDYYFRIVGRNESGTSRGEILSFKTSNVYYTPTPTPYPTYTPTYTPTPTRTPTPTYTPTPTQTPNNGSVLCIGSQSVRVGQIASFTGTGGSGAYRWSAPDGAPFIGGPSRNFATVYSTVGIKTVTLSDAHSYVNNSRCYVNVTPASTVTPTPTQTITPTYTPTPTPTYTPTPTPYNVLPGVQTIGVRDITNTSAILEGRVQPNNTTARVWFEYGFNSSSLQFTTDTLGFNGNGSLDFTRLVSDLQVNQIYYYRAVASNSNGTVRGSILSFTTGHNVFGQVPLVETRDASFVSHNAAILNSYVNPRGYVTTAWFEYGNTTNFGQRTEYQIIGNTFGNLTFSSAVSGLSANTVYYFKVVAQNQYGQSHGNIVSFKTSTTPGLTPTPTYTPTPTKTPYPPYYPGPTYSPKNNGDADISCFAVNPSLNPAFPKSGQEFTYTVTFRNGCKFDLNTTSLKITLPQEVEFLSTNTAYFAEGNNTYVYNLNVINRSAESSISIRGKVRDTADKGDTLIFSSSFSFTDYNGKVRLVVNNLMDSVGEGKGFGANFGAGMALIFKGFHGSGFGWLLLLVLISIILFLIYLLVSEKRHQERLREIESQRFPNQSNLYQR